MICPLFLAAEISKEAYDMDSEDPYAIRCREENCEWYDEMSRCCCVGRMMGALQVIASGLTSTITIRKEGDPLQ